MQSLLQGTNGLTVEGKPAAAETLTIEVGTGSYCHHGSIPGFAGALTTATDGALPGISKTAADLAGKTSVRACNVDGLWPLIRRDYFPGYWGTINYGYSLAAPNQFEQAFKVAAMLLKEGIVAELTVPAFVALVKTIEETL